MLPHKHFLFAIVVILVASFIFFPQLSFIDLVLWVVIGGIMSAAVDLDVMVLLNVIKLPPKLKKYKKPLGVFEDYKGFMKALCETGVIRKVIVTHIAISAVFILIFYFFANVYFVPVVLGVLSHLITDVKGVREAQS